MNNIWPKIFVIGYGEDARTLAMFCAINIRWALFQKRQSIKCEPMACVEIGYDGNLKKQLQKANKFLADYVVILKDEENAIIKDMKTGQQQDIKSAYLADEFQRLMEEEFYA